MDTETLTWNIREHHHDQEDIIVKGKIETIWHGHTVQTRLGNMTKRGVYCHQFTLKTTVGININIRRMINCPTQL